MDVDLHVFVFAQYLYNSILYIHNQRHCVCSSTNPHHRMVTYTTQTRDLFPSVFCLHIVCFIKTKMIQKLTLTINGYWSTFPWVKRPQSESPFSAELKNECSYISTPIKQKYLIIFNIKLKEIINYFCTKEIMYLFINSYQFYHTVLSTSFYIIKIR